MLSNDELNAIETNNLRLRFSAGGLSPLSFCKKASLVSKLQSQDIEPTISSLSNSDLWRKWNRCLSQWKEPPRIRSFDYLCPMLEITELTTFLLCESSTRFAWRWSREREIYIKILSVIQINYSKFYFSCSISVPLASSWFKCFVELLHQEIACCETTWRHSLDTSCQSRSRFDFIAFECSWKLK